MPPEISDLVGGSPELLLAIPEHKIALPGGRRDSQCDVFALVRGGDETLAIAIEAKVNETFGPTIGEWMSNASEGKQERLRFICDLFGHTVRPGQAMRHILPSGMPLVLGWAIGSPEFL